MTAAVSGGGNPTIELGSSGVAVKTWQSILARSGVALGASGVDGKFGQGTKQATMGWQTAHGLTADGVVGPATWAASTTTPPLVASAPGVSLGFDVGTYPGDATMTLLQKTYAFTGYYLPGAPAHTETSWKGKRAFLEQIKLRMLVTYVGHQQGSPLLTVATGQANAADAIQRASVEGFAAGTVVFLDVEYADTISQAMLTYLGAWLQGFAAAGSAYRPGLYCHIHNLAAVQAATASLAAPTFWICGGQSFSVASSPGGCGLPSAAAWQGWLDTADPSGTVDFEIDVNVATSGNSLFV